MQQPTSPGPGVRVLAAAAALIVAVVLAVVFLVRDEDRVRADAGTRSAADERPTSTAGNASLGGRGQISKSEGAGAARTDLPELSDRQDETFPEINATEEMERRASATIDDDWQRFLADAPSLGDEERAEVLQILRDFQRTARAALSTYDGDVTEFFRVVVPDLWAEAYARGAEILTPRQLRVFNDQFRTAGTTLALADRLIGEPLSTRAVVRDAM